MKTRSLFYGMFVVLFAIAVNACTSINPISAADSVEQRAYATYGTYVIARERASELTSPASDVSEDVQRAILRAESRASPLVDDLSEAFQEYVVIRSRYESGESTLESLSRASSRLDEAVAASGDVVQEFRKAISGVSDDGS